MLQWVQAHPNLAAWVQALGSILAIVAAFLVPVGMALAERRSVRKLTAMEITIGLRRWVRECAEDVLIVNGWDHKNEPEPNCNLPKFPYSPRLIAKLRPGLALAVAQLMEEREKVIERLRSASFYLDSISYHEPYTAHTARLILSALDVLVQTTREAGWHFDDIDPRTRERLAMIVRDDGEKQSATSDWLSGGEAKSTSS